MISQFISRLYLKLHTFCHWRHGFQNRINSVFICVAFLSVLTGCASDPFLYGNRPDIQLSPESFGQNISVQQQLHVIQNGQTHDLQVVLEIDKDKITLVGLAMNQRVLTLDYDGKTLHSWRHFMLPKEVQAENVLENLQLAFWPKAVIEKALPKDWRIEENPQERYIFYKDAKMTDIKYNNPIRWLGTIVLENHYYHYSLTIQSVSMSPEHDLSE